MRNHYFCLQIYFTSRKCNFPENLMSVCQLITWSVDRTVIISQKGGMLHLHAPFGALCTCCMHERWSNMGQPKCVICEICTHNISVVEVKTITYLFQRSGHGLHGGVRVSKSAAGAQSQTNPSLEVLLYSSPIKELDNF